MSLQDEGPPIPQPPTDWFIGNVRSIDPSNLAASLWRLADIYGDIFQLDLPGRKVVVCNTHELVSDLCDSTRFEKTVNGGLKEVRALTGDGLFTAYPGAKTWGIAHRLLMPVFGPLGIRKMFPEMLDIISQMLLQWDRFGPDNELVTADQFTRLTFDVIGLCAFGYRFNNFYRDNTHPFVNQMGDVLLECGRRASRTSIENALRVFTAQETAANVQAMLSLTEEIIVERKKHPQPDSNDLLNPMLFNTDPVTGEKMSDDLIRDNMVTFLVAGHETTSGTLAFLFYHLLKNPDKYMAAQKEVDEVLGDGPLELKHLPQLKYVKYAIFETLRFLGPIQTPAKHAIDPTLIGGKYYVEPSTQIIMNLRPFHHDRKVWGEDADVFRPERWLNGGAEKLPANSFKAFGDGERACIGRTFAEQEMIMAVALILQNFQVEMPDPSYQLHLKVTLTLKPDDFSIKVRRRPGRSLGNFGTTASPAPQVSQERKDSGVNGVSKSEEKPITVFYGSQAGTCEAYAQDIESNAARFGFKAKIATLDSATENIPKDQPVVIICPTYEGKPADNAKKFVTWLEANASSTEPLKGVRYALFGVGNSDWVKTFLRVPKRIDALFEKMGAEKFLSTACVDVKEDIMGPWDEFTNALWSTLRKDTGQTAQITSNALQTEITPPTFASHLGGKEIGYGHVKINKSLGGEEVGLGKKHMEVDLPLGSGYQSGDYLVVLPMNNVENVRRVSKRFDLSPDDSILVTGTNKAFLSPDTSISVFDLMMTRVELGTPASQKQIQTLIEATPEEDRSKLTSFLSEETYKSTVLAKRYSILDLLESSPTTHLPFSTYLDMLKPLTPRQYSISSSPLANINFATDSNGRSVQKLTASITYDVHDEAAWSGHGQFHGVASTYLARHEEGQRIRCFTRPTNAKFHLPADTKTPIIMVCAGTGIAPMRAFLQERATIKAAREVDLGPALLYFGCRSETADYIYKDELEQWEKEGVVSLRTCFSKSGPKAPQYVYERMWEEWEELRKLFKEDHAKIFVCGSARKLAKSTGEVCMKIYKEATGCGEDEAAEWLDTVKEDRYVSDVFE